LKTIASKALLHDVSVRVIKPMATNLRDLPLPLSIGTGLSGTEVRLSLPRVIAVKAASQDPSLQIVARDEADSLVLPLGHMYVLMSDNYRRTHILQKILVPTVIASLSGQTKKFALS
jgi:hypothetical protein